MVARIHCDFFSETLGMATSMTVLLPEPHRRPGHVSPAAGQPPDGHPLLLASRPLRRPHRLDPPNGPRALCRRHGPRRRHARRRRGASIQTWPRGRPTSPSSATSFSPPRARSSRSPSDPERCFAAGLSMGGYGAVKLVLRYPDRVRRRRQPLGRPRAAEAATPQGRPRRAEHRRIFGRAEGASATTTSSPSRAGGLLAGPAPAPLRLLRHQRLPHR